MYTATPSETLIPQVENSWSFNNHQNVEGLFFPIFYSAKLLLANFEKKLSNSQILVEQDYIRKCERCFEYTTSQLPGSIQQPD